MTCIRTNTVRLFGAGGDKSVNMSQNEKCYMQKTGGNYCPLLSTEEAPAGVWGTAPGGSVEKLERI